MGCVTELVQEQRGGWEKVSCHVPPVPCYAQGKHEGAVLSGQVVIRTVLLACVKLVSKAVQILQQAYTFTL